MSWESSGYCARIGEDGSYPFDDLTECAIITHGIDADLAQTVVSKGIEAGLLPIQTCLVHSLPAAPMVHDIL
jgi:hypothetical protein